MNDTDNEPAEGVEVNDATAGADATTTVEAVVDPPLVEAVSLTVYCPGSAKVCDGLCAELVPPSPKSHDHDVGDPVEVSVNATATGAVPVVVEAEKEAVGRRATTTTEPDAAVEPPVFAAVRVTEYVPSAVNVCDGFCAELVPPSPKSHDQDEGEPVEVSVNDTVTGAVPDVLEAEKEAIGAGGRRGPESTNQYRGDDMVAASTTTPDASDGRLPGGRRVVHGRVGDVAQHWRPVRREDHRRQGRGLLVDRALEDDQTLRRRSRCRRRAARW